MSEVYPEDENMGFEERLTRAVENMNPAPYTDLSLVKMVERLERKLKIATDSFKQIIDDWDCVHAECGECGGTRTARVALSEIEK